MLPSIFDLQGPQLAKEEFGPEPTLEEMVYCYYKMYNSPSKAKELCDKYIAGWIGLNRTSWN